MSELPRIPVAAPSLIGREAEYVQECMTSTWISSIGRFIDEFEQGFADFCGVKHAVACNNGTTALHLALVALGVGPGDEVIVPTLTYIASANAVTYCGATPVFIDSDESTFNLDPAKLEALITPRTRAIMPVHLYGHPADMDPIREVARRHGLWVVEDAAEAVGARYKGARTGALGDCGVFSFFGNKIITTGEGGMVTTDDDELAKRLRLYRGQGMDPERRYWFPVIGYNYRMTNIAAAIGLGQLERIEDHLAARKRVAETYAQRLAGVAGLSLPKSEPWAEHVYWMYTVLLERTNRSRDEIMASLERAGIETRPVFYPLHTLPPYEAMAKGEYPHALSIGERGLNLPTYSALRDEDIDRVVEALSQALG